MKTLVIVLSALTVIGTVLLVWVLLNRQGEQDVVGSPSDNSEKVGVELKLVAKFGDEYSAKLVTTLFSVDRDHDGYIHNGAPFKSVEEAVVSACSEASSDDARKRCEAGLREGEVLKGVGDCDDDTNDDPSECFIGEMDCNAFAYAVCAQCIHPGAQELDNDNMDNDCDGLTDEKEEMRDLVRDLEPSRPERPPEQ